LTVHVVGAGVAGLAAAIALVDAGRDVVVHEAAPVAGGRCRALPDGTDNGTHALVGANHAALRFLDRIGARAGWVEPEPHGLPVLDVADGSARRVGLSPLHWHRASRRPDGMSAGALWAMARLALSPRDQTIGVVLAGQPRFLRSFVEPLTIAALNTPAAEASSRKLGAVLRRIRGLADARLFVARDGLGPDLVAPALAALGGRVRFGARLRGLDIADGAVTALRFDDTMPVGAVVLAVPPWEVARLLPSVPVPTSHAPIVNLHFARRDAGPVRFLGLVGALCQWVLVRPSGVSVTVSAGDAEAEQGEAELAPRAWAEIRQAAAAFGLPGAWPEATPSCRVVKERRATPRQFPGAPRPPAPRVLRNLVLAGDWLDPILPATIEAATRSGVSAARHV